MKKLFAILAVVVMTSIFAFAAPISQSTTLTNNAGVYTANIYCLPTLAGGSSIVLGNFFTGQSNVNVSSASPQTYNVNGPNLSTEVWNFTANGAGLAASGFQISGTMNAADKLTGGWAITEADGLGLDPGEYNVGTGDYHISEAVDMTCNGTPWRAVFQPSTLTTGSVTGAETFPITFTAILNI
jgi:hypothetical protein